MTKMRDFVPQIRVMIGKRLLKTALVSIALLIPSHLKISNHVWLSNVQIGRDCLMMDHVFHVKIIPKCLMMVKVAFSRDVIVVNILRRMESVIIAQARRFPMTTRRVV